MELLLLAVLFSTPFAALATMAGAASIPVIIHLLNRRRFRVVDWGAMRFLQAALKRSVQRLRFEHWLLLAVRVLLVLLPILAMAAATPWAEAWWERLIPSAAGPAQFAGRTHHIIVVDSSLSMTAQNDDGSAFDRALSQANKIVTTARGGDGFSVIQLAGSSRAVIPGPANDPQRVANDIREMACTNGSVDLQQGLHLVHDIVSRSSTQFHRRVVYLITDLQRTQWAAPATTTNSWTEVWQRLHADAEVAIVDVGANRSDNVAITALSINDSLIAAGTSTTATFTVQNFGPLDRKQIRLQIAMAKTAHTGRPGTDTETFPLRVLRQELLDLPAGSSTTVSALIEFRTAGDYRLEARLEDDTLAADNWRATNISVCDEVPVLVVNGRPAVSPWETASGWLTAALDPFPAGARPSGFPARPQVILDSKLDDPELNLAKFGMIFLCDVPRVTPRTRDRLDEYVRGGGTLIFSLGPLVDGDSYRRLLYQDGQGLLPAQLVRRQKATEGHYFSLVFDDDLFRRPPFLAFAGDDDRASLLTARCQEYWQIELSPKLPARRFGSFTPSSGAGDPVMVEWSVGQGRTILFTSTLNTQWSSWPIAPSFPPFVQELFRYAVRQPPRRELVVGEIIDNALPENVAVLEATVKTPDGQNVTVPLVSDQDVPHLRFNDTNRSGLYHVGFANRPPRVFVVNVPAGVESDLNRIPATELPITGTGEPALVVADVARIPTRPPVGGTVSAAISTAGLGVIGPKLARWLLLAAFVLILVELILAWQLGSNRGGPGLSDGTVTTTRLPLIYKLLSILSYVMITLIAVGASIVLHAVLTGEVLSFLPNSIRGVIERGLGVPPPVVGESTLWRFDRLAFLTNDPATDRWFTAAAGILALGLCGYVYFRELNRRTWRSGVAMIGLRMGLVLLLVLVLLPQLRLVFERAGWPDYVIIIDDSKSMGVVDHYQDAEMKSAITNLTDHASSTTRLQLAQRILCAQDNHWLQELGVRRQSRLHVYHVADRVERLATIDEPHEVTLAAKTIESLAPTGASSRLGDAVRAVLEQFRGSALGGIMVLTDGITTDGDDCSIAARHASRAGVPVTFVGIGEGREPKDVILSDLRVDDVVHANDRLVFEARVMQRGDVQGSCPVVLYEKQGNELTELARQEVSLDAGGGPAKVRLTHTPKAPGEHTFVLEVPAQPDESDLSNNRLERSVLVVEFQRTRVLFVEGRPRNDYRFAKTLLEREAESVRGNKSIELRVLLADADLDYARQDRTALESFPASKDELFRQFDVIILGDIEPNHPLLGEKRLQWIADFVREKGGGLLILCGQQAMPLAYRGTPLADIIPIDVASVDALGTVRPAGYRPRLTNVGVTHPVLRFVLDEQENIQVWEKLKPFYWAATGLKPKPAAEVLANTPSMTGVGTGEPLIVQQFVGAGRVLLIGFEESWRWRFRSDEIRFNQFWIQLVRFLARTRPSRPEIRLDRQTAYHRGEPIRVTIHFPEDKPAPETNSVVRVEMRFQGTNQGSERTLLQMAAVPGAPRTFETVVTRTPDGSYTFTLQNAPTNVDRPPSVEGRVLPPPGEMDRLKMNRGDMERAAQISRGRFYTLTDLGRVMDELPPVPHVTLNQPCPPWPIWNTPLIAALSLALVGSEWVLRKRHQLL